MIGAKNLVSLSGSIVRFYGRSMPSRAARDDRSGEPKPAALLTPKATSGGRFSADRPSAHQIGSDAVDTTNVATVIGLLIALSVAAERLVEIVKNLTPSLAKERDTPAAEGRRQAVLHVLGVVAGIVTAYLARPAIPGGVLPVTDHYTATLALGLLASGGSGFWNSVLTYVLQLKELTKVQVKKTEREANLGPDAIRLPIRDDR